MPYEAWFRSEISETGAFVRQNNRFTVPFGDSEGDLPIESGRYKIIVSYACPWAHRQLIVLNLLGLDKHIKVGVVDPIRPDSEFSDWAFTLDLEGVDPDLKIKRLSELYLKSDPGYQGRFTVPSVVDLKTGKIVNNDYFNLTYYWERQWKKLHKEDAPDLLPKDLQNKIAALNDIIFSDVNNGVYKAGFANSQDEYEKAYDAVFARLDEFEKRLEGQKYLFGDRLTDSDVRLYVTLARFDAAYYSVFRVNRNRLIDYKNLWRYARSLYNIPSFGQTTHFDHIKKHYCVCCDPGNLRALVPKGPDLSVWGEPYESIA
ncbi:MAG: glutathione S-transferase C-terminal domain-containing protein [Clostridiales bacterium]|jgi:putative glutathione S-transferase|nr:glutathione S-transferase C-terminal domain-containing protein [Clostridiales bacterium]